MTRPFTITLNVNGTAYGLDEPVSWDDAIAQGGFYFDRARYLGLPQPPARLFDEDAPGYFLAFGEYHCLFREAEASAITQEPYWE
jgi:hypothetical protein